MKSKTKVLTTTLLLCCTLVLTFTLSAGCTIIGSSDSVVGTWVPDESTLPDYGRVIIFNSDKTFSVLFVENMNKDPNVKYAEVTGKWEKNGDNVYTLTIHGYNGDVTTSVTTFGGVMTAPAFSTPGKHSSNFKKDNSFKFGN